MIVVSKEDINLVSRETAYEKYLNGEKIFLVPTPERESCPSDSLLQGKLISLETDLEDLFWVHIEEILVPKKVTDCNTYIFRGRV